MIATIGKTFGWVAFGILTILPFRNEIISVFNEEIPSEIATSTPAVATTTPEKEPVVETKITLVERVIEVPKIVEVPVEIPVIVQTPVTEVKPSEQPKETPVKEVKPQETKPVVKEEQKVCKVVVSRDGVALDESSYISIPKYQPIPSEDIKLDYKQNCGSDIHISAPYKVGVKENTVPGVPGSIMYRPEYKSEYGIDQDNRGAIPNQTHMTFFNGVATTTVLFIASI